MGRFVCAWLWLAMAATATPLAAQEAVVREASRPWFIEVLAFVLSIPFTLYLIFADGQRWHLLPAPLVGLWVFIWSFREWRRQRYWTPRLIPILSVLALATIVLINVDWVMNGGEMWTQRYVVIAIFGLFPWIAYIVLGGPRLIGRRRLDMDFGPATTGPAEAPAEVDAYEDSTHGVPHPWAPAKTRMEGPLWVRLGAIGVVGVAAVVAFLASGIQASELRPDLAVLRTPESVVPGARGELRGNGGAPITIFVFGDYQCEACAFFANNYRPMLDSAYVDPGEARIVFFDRPFRNRHPHAELAARAAYCAGEQDAFWSYQDRLFLDQEEWSPLGDPRAVMAQYATDLGLDPTPFTSCLESDRHTDRVAANEELADRLGITSTPTIVVARRGGDPRRASKYTFRVIERTILEVTARGAS